MTTSHTDRPILSTLQDFAQTVDAAKHLVSFVALFPATPALSEAEFEHHLWRRLQALHELDAKQYAWADEVSSDPEAPDFGMSFGGKGFFVVGLHPGASRLARRSPVAALVFNAHAQFERLKEDGRYGRLQSVIRERDTALQGSINPMLAEHGRASEAPQYSGREIANDWQCPFRKATA